MVNDVWYTLNLDNYYEYLNSIIKTRGKYNIVDEYYEVHHIIPRAFNGEPNKITHKSKHENLIWLTLDEHFTAHQILASDNKNNYKVVYAYMFMSTKKDKSTISDSIEYKSIREAFIQHNKQLNLGKQSPMKGKKFSDEFRAKVSLATKLAMSDSEIRKKISDSCKGREPWNKSRTNVYSEESIQKMRDKKLGVKLSEQHCKNISNAKIGHEVSEETKQKISHSQSGERCKRNKAVYCIELDTIFYSCKYAAEQLNINGSNIVQVCKGKRKSVSGFHFRYVEYEDKVDKED